MARAPSHPGDTVETGDEPTLQHADTRLVRVIRSQLLPLALRLGLTSRDTIDGAAVERLVTDNVVEDDGIDFKESMYVANEHGRDSLAKDIAAFANHRGGVLVVGIKDTNGVAVSHHPFAGGDATKRHVTSVHGTRVRPMVPGLHAEWVPTSSTDGYLLIGVPASPLAPHAAGNPNDDQLEFPVRAGSQTRYMSEAELASRYVARNVIAQSARDRSLGLKDEPLHRMQRDDPWAHVSVVPHALGSMELSHGIGYRFREWFVERAPLSVWGQRLMDNPDFEVGHRRVTTGLWLPPSRMCAYFIGELHTDGSAFTGRQIDGDDRNPLRNPENLEELAHLIPSQSLINAVATSLRLAALHALDNASTSGTAHVVAGITPGAGDNERGLVFGRWDPRGIAPRSRTLRTVPEVERVVSLDALAADGVEWMSVTKSIVDELAQAFGVEEVALITSAGEIRAAQWSSSNPREILRFAEENGIPIV